ncbi:hypothetical protein [Martelella limonii]|uniref:hypothetical protein n=1 Tax=Martelella limonii TaxID=1647649 RepID=UPI0015810890|nr:hypothetical protein [Martelella limonii]
MNEFDYQVEAALYPGRKAKGNRSPRYRRFDTAADAVRFAVEEMEGCQLRGSVLEIEESRYDDRQIRKLYDAPEYPLVRSEK